MFDRPIRLDWLKDIDAKLELNVKRVVDSPISVENIRSAVTLSNGKLSATLRGELAGVPVNGQIHLDDVRLFDVDKDTGPGPAVDKSRVIPDYTIPVDVLLAADLDLDIQAERIRSGLEDLGDLVIKVSLKDGRFKSSTNIRSHMGARISGEHDINTAFKPPLIKIQLNAKDLNYGLLLRLIFMIGPLTGTISASAARYSVVAKSPLTGIWGHGNSGGSFGPALKRSGFDGIIFEGISPKPVYLRIIDGQAELCDAGELWGKTVPRVWLQTKPVHFPIVSLKALSRNGFQPISIGTVILTGPKLACEPAQIIIYGKT